ncbi:SUKH-4 family immunity protein [Pseudonocardia acaciae]|uniref:SUKH-4 family immunity protein n=1 Tax=Pseudonocardia acaciae TaxID=551276 RepID=UPI00048B878B|nr:SUKH-4 family immunity protein [Pseudonocardia acaciae]
MALTYGDLADRWGDEQLIHLPLDKIASKLTFNFDLLSPGGALPSDVPYLFTIHLAGQPDLFNEIHSVSPDRAPNRFLVIGAAPETLKMLYGLDMATGAVALMNTRDQSIEPINSSLALFVEFLHRIAPWVTPNAPLHTIAEANELRTELRALDPSAFDSPESWWSMVLDRLAQTS